MKLLHYEILGSKIHTNRFTNNGDMDKRLNVYEEVSL